MADSTPLLEQIDSAQAAHEVTANALIAALSPASLYGRHAEECAGLTWGGYGGMYAQSIQVANWSLALTASSTCYIVADKATGLPEFDTTDTNWGGDDTDPPAAGYERLYKVVTGASTVTSWVDYRGALGATVIGGDMVLDDVQIVTGAKTFGAAGAVGKFKIAGNTSGAATLDAPAVAGSIVITLPATTGTLATTADVSNAVNGLSWKTAVRVASTANGTLASAFENGDTVDGVTLATGDRILLKDQSAGAENGIYVVAASGAPARAADADSGAELVNASVYVSEGTANADSQWTCTTNATITIGSTSLTFALVAAGVYQPLDADLTAIAALAATTDNFLQAKSSAWASRTVAQVTADLQGTGLLTDAAGFRYIPSNSQSTAYTTVAADNGKSIDHPSTDANARTFTIDSNANVAYPVGTTISFSNMTSQVVTIAITSDTMYLAGPGTTGSRSLAQYGSATARKLTSTTWLISGVGLT